MENNPQKCRHRYLGIGMTDGNNSSVLDSNRSITDRSKVHVQNRDIGFLVPETIQDQETPVSDSESGICGASLQGSRIFGGDGMIRLEGGDKEHNNIKQRFLLGMRSVGRHTEVVRIHKNSFSNFLGRTRIQSFGIFSGAITQKCHGNANIKYVWYGTSKDGIEGSFLMVLGSVGGLRTIDCMVLGSSRTIDC
ncbi:PREDICTED: probable inactive poly [ADP-ribose] polymerase SRO2 [Nelumbo nucifera]|uniref:Probable inactive poly [ADP-ribose] polymerase SRO2 n=1 Tax=Nelumbo nucifera TaxID=4432 RepID=A0A1U8PYA2_NELNU|nr:PREDICTED: probable inactive poly [ADP-ribose] polymerase SRO2 [Nelumbo nucifera]